MSLLLLVIAFLFTGVAMIPTKALGAMGLGDYAALFTLGFWGTGLVIGLMLESAARDRARPKEAALGFGMGLCAAGTILLLLAALDRLDGVIAFPARSCGSILLTAALAVVLYREQLSGLQWLGIACAIAAITLLV